MLIQEISVVSVYQHVLLVPEEGLNRVCSYMLSDPMKFCHVVLDILPARSPHISAEVRGCYQIPLSSFAKMPPLATSSFHS